MSKPNHHPLLPLGLALVLITVTSLASFVPRARPQGPPPDPKDVATTAIPVSALPKDFNIADDEKELDELRRQGFKVGKTVAFRSVPKQSASAAWEARLHGATIGDEINGGYHTITDLDDGDINDMEWRHKTYIGGVSISAVINTTYGDDHWITNTSQSGYYISSNASPLDKLAKCGTDAIMPTLFALPDGGCRFTTTREMRTWIVDNAFQGALDQGLGAFGGCLAQAVLTTGGLSTGMCMGITFMGYLSAKIMWNVFDAVVLQGCSGWSGAPQDPSNNPTVYVDGFRWW